MLTGLTVASAAAASPPQLLHGRPGRAAPLVSLGGLRLPLRLWGLVLLCTEGGLLRGQHGLLGLLGLLGGRRPQLSGQLLG